MTFEKLEAELLKGEVMFWCEDQNHFGSALEYLYGHGFYGSSLTDSLLPSINGDRLHPYRGVYCSRPGERELYSVMVKPDWVPVIRYEEVAHLAEHYSEPPSARDFEDKLNRLLFQRG